MRKLQALMLGLALTAPLALGACGAPALTATSQLSGPVESQSVPPASAFKTIQAKVTKILPMDTHGLPHQNFVVTVISGNTGKPGDIPAVGGAMDVAIGAKDVYVMMTLFTKSGAPKLVPQCTYPLTGVGCVSRVYTEVAAFDLRPDGVHVLETYGVTLEELRSRLAIELH